ncbi:MAG: GDSL-type esterase/lipase family protein [Acidimicrobiaceae bacterium]
MLNRFTRVRRFALLTVAVCLTVAAGISTPFTPNTGPSLLILGDSITWGTEYFAKSQKLIAADEQWTNIVIDGQYSRRVAFPTPNASTKYSGVKTFKKLSDNGLRADAVIVALGSNDVAIETKEAVYELIIRDLMTTIGDVPVTWLTVNRRDTPAIAKRSILFNQVLARLAPEYPNLVLEDWYSTIAKRSKWMAWDKVHLTPSGYQARAKLHQRLARELFDRHIIATTPTTTTTVPPTTAPPATVPPAPTDTSPSTTTAP